MHAMRTELAEFVALQEEVLQVHDNTKGVVGWKENTAQALASRLTDQFGEMLAHLFGDNPVCDFLINSIRDQIEESGVDLDYDPATLRTKLADIANFCMMLHNVAGNITPHQSNQSVA